MKLQAHLPIVAIGERDWHAAMIALVSLFGATALLLGLLARSRSQELAATAATIALGCAIEFAQHSIYHSRMEWRDIRDDTYGALAALALLLWPAVKPFLVRDAAPGAVLTHQAR